MKNWKKKPQGNRRIKNAKKVVWDGVKFDSKLELFAYQSFKQAGIDFGFQVKFELQPGFRFQGDAVRAITLTIDFALPEHKLYVDTKGYSNDIFPLKAKMFKYYLLNRGLVDRDLIILRTQTQVSFFVDCLTKKNKRPLLPEYIQLLKKDRRKEISQFIANNKY